MTRSPRPALPPLPLAGNDGCALAVQGTPTPTPTYAIFRPPSNSSSTSSTSQDSPDGQPGQDSPDQPQHPLIPPVVHQVWVGTDSPPSWVRTLWEEWDDATQPAATGQTLTVRRWTNDDLPSTLTGRWLAKASRSSSRSTPHPSEWPVHPVVVADLLRVEILYLHGGLYMDSDTRPLRVGPDTDPSLTRDWTGHRAAWIGQGPPDRSAASRYAARAAPAHHVHAGQVVNNATMGFPALHPFLEALWDRASAAVARGNTRAFDIAGPNVVRRLLHGTRPTPDPSNDPTTNAPDRPYLPHPEIPRGPFVSTTQRDAALETKRGRPLTLSELRERYPRAVVAHMSMVSWQPSIQGAARQAAAWSR